MGELYAIERALEGNNGPNIDDFVDVGQYFRDNVEVFREFAHGVIGLESYLTQEAQIRESIISHIEVFDTSNELYHRLRKNLSRKIARTVIDHETEHAKAAAALTFDNKWGYYDGGSPEKSFACVFHPNYTETIRNYHWGREDILIAIAKITDVSIKGETDRKLESIAKTGRSLIDVGIVPAYDGLRASA